MNRYRCLVLCFLIGIICICSGKADNSTKRPHILLSSSIDPVITNLYSLKNGEIYYAPRQWGILFRWDGTKLYRLEGEKLIKRRSIAHCYTAICDAANDDQYVLVHKNVWQGELRETIAEWYSSKTDELIAKVSDNSTSEMQRNYFWNGKRYISRDENVYLVDEKGERCLYTNVIDVELYHSAFIIQVLDENEKTIMYLYTPDDEEPIVNYNQKLHALLDVHTEIQEYRASTYNILFYNNIFYYKGIMDDVFYSLELTNEGLNICKLEPYEGAKVSGSFCISENMLYSLHDTTYYAYDLLHDTWTPLFEIPEDIAKHSPEIVISGRDVYISVDPFFNVNQRSKLFYLNLNEPNIIKTLYTIPSNQWDRIPSTIVTNK